MSIFSERLKRIREKKKKENPIWTQEYVAKKIGVARVTYTAYETGSKQPPLETVRKISSLFHVSSDYLIGNTDDPDLYSNREEVEQAIREKGLTFGGKDLSQLSEKDRKLIEEMIERLLNEN